MKYVSYIVFYVYFFSFTAVLAQSADSVARESQPEIAERASELETMREQQYKDSLYRIKLEDQLLDVKLGDGAEKSRLMAELRALQSRDSIMMARRKTKVDSLRQLNKGIPVVAFRDTLYHIYTSIGSYSAQDRADAVESRLQNLADNMAFNTDSMQIEQNEDTWLLSWKDQILLSVNQQDALWANQEAGTLITAYKARVKQAIDNYREATSLSRILKAIGLSFVILASLSLIIVGIGRISRFLKRKILSSRGHIFNGIKIKGYTLVTAKNQIKFVWSILTLLRWILIIVSVYLALPIILNLFPETEGYAPVLLGYFLAPLRKVGTAFLHYIPNMITIAVIYVVFHYVLKLLKFFAKELQSEALKISGFYKEWALPTYQILRILLLAFFLVVIFPYLPGSDSPIFKGISVFIGVLFTFSSAGALGNIVAGLMLTYMRSFAIGDRIQIGEISGDIIEKSLLVTRIRTIKNEVISIPNAQILNNHTINYSADAEELGLIVHVKITLSYEIPWQDVHQLAITAANKVDLLAKDPAPFVLQTGLDDFYVAYQLNAYTKYPHKQAFIYSELYKHILDVFHEAGVEILSPHYHAVRDGSLRDIPESYRKEQRFNEPFHVKIKREDQ
ncbi:mechanosensitive ion channel family protein [Sphingobacterium sp. LRF_L2]|uniref:mechanosensitive ion channel family protein n=1 Tax=Sphingobacterium sp. LRF_L2 TaxID=3369421 RepID=UPI003F648F36